MFCSDISDIYKNIANGKLYMHQNEGVIGDEENTIMRKVNRFFQANALAGKINVSSETISNLSMYNAGVLGFNSNQKHILSNALVFTDQVYSVFPKHIIEQLAFSLYMQASGPIYEAREEIFHYWNFKEFRMVLKSFFERYNHTPFELLIERIGRIDPKQLIKPKLEYEKTRDIRRVYKKLMKGKWQLPAYDL